MDLYVLVADSHVVRLLRYESQGALAELVVSCNSDAGLHERELVADRRGRMINSAAGIHQACGNRPRRCGPGKEEPRDEPQEKAPLPITRQVTQLLHKTPPRVMQEPQEQMEPALSLGVKTPVLEGEALGTHA